MLNRLIRLVLPGVAVFASCGDDGPPTTMTPPTTLPACVRTVVYERSGRLPANTLVFDGFVTGTRGRLDLTVDWTFPTTPIILSLADHPPCDLQTPIERCGVLASSGAGPKPRTLSLSDAAPGSYWLYILNDGPEADSAAAQVVLSSPTCPAFAAAAGERDLAPGTRITHAVPW
jgi:hypothetical protein